MRYCRPAILLVGLSACSTDPHESTLPLQHTLTVVAGQASTGACPAGGVTLEHGVDENGDGDLDAGEVDQTYEVCNGESIDAALLDDLQTRLGALETTVATLTDLASRVATLEAASVDWSDVQHRPEGLDDGDDVGLMSVDWSDVQNPPTGLDDGDQSCTITHDGCRTVVTCGADSAVVTDCVTLSGSLVVDSKTGTDPSSLDVILGHTNTWTLTLFDTHQHVSSDPFVESWVGVFADGGFSFTFEGPDAALLNAEVASKLTQGGLGGAFFESRDNGTSQFNQIYLWPADPFDGVYLAVLADYTFPLDAGGFPVLEDFTAAPALATLYDRRGATNISLDSTSWGPSTMSADF